MDQPYNSTTNTLKYIVDVYICRRRMRQSAKLDLYVRYATVRSRGCRSSPYPPNLKPHVPQDRDLVILNPAQPSQIHGETKFAITSSIMFYAMAFGLRSRGSFRKYLTRPFNQRTPPGVLREWAIIQGSVASGGWWSAASHASGLNWVLKVLCPHVAQPRCTVDPRNIGSAQSSGNPHTLSLLRRPWREWTLRYAIESPHLAFSSHQSSQSVPQNRGI